MDVYTFHVEWALNKDTLMAGETCGGISRIKVAADSLLDARLTAEQMVAAVGHEPTQATLISVR